MFHIFLFSCIKNLHTTNKFLKHQRKLL